MVVLVGGEDEERVLRRDAVFGEAGEELAKCFVKGGKLADVTRFAGPECAGVGDVVVMSVLDLAVDNRDACFDHRCQIPSV